MDNFFKTVQSIQEFVKKEVEGLINSDTAALKVMTDERDYWAKSYDVASAGFTHMESERNSWKAKSEATMTAYNEKIELINSLDRQCEALKKENNLLLKERSKEQFRNALNSISKYTNDNLYCYRVSKIKIPSAGEITLIVDPTLAPGTIQIV